MLTIQDVELLALLLQRAGVTQIEATWANATLDRLRSIALEHQTKAALEQQKDAQDDAD